MPQILLTSASSYIGNTIFVILVCGVLVLFVLYIKKVITSILDGFEMLYAQFTKRPIFIHFYPIRRKLNAGQIKILKSNFTFYNRLDAKHQSYFRHRMATFLLQKNFEGKDDFEITEEVKVLISATAIMLTFGFRNYTIPYIKNILVYPTQYYSTVNKIYHKGEYNARYETLVLSWDNFMEGYRIDDDKVNLGIHEFTHAIHYNCMKQNDINSIIFVDTFSELREQLSANEQLKNDLVASNFIRSYALINDSELLAVIVETFIEAPKEFSRLFPEVYTKLRQMLNFNFSGY